MMDINEIRHRNVRLLIRRMEEAEGRVGDRAGGPTMLAAKLKKSTGQVAHFASENPVKPIGNQIAREIELALGLERGWMDWLQDVPGGAQNSQSQPARLDPGIVRGVARAMQDTASALKIDLTIQETAEIAAEMYERVSGTEVKTADVVWLIKRIEQGSSRHAGTGGV